MHEPGPVRPECPLSCLRLSRRAANPLRAHLRSNAVTVGDVVRLWEKDELHLVFNLGPCRIEEIVTALTTAGLIHHEHH